MSTPTTTAVADARIPAEHPFAAHLRRAAALEAPTPHRAWTPEDGWLSTADGGSGGNHVKIARLPLGGFGLLKAGGDAAEKWQGAAKARQADGQATGAGMTLPPMHS